jgi:5,10-methylenetetrahydrofolate reductase
VSILAGIIPLKSAKMARWLAGNVPGIVIPEPLFAEMEEAARGNTEVDAGIDIAGRVIRSLRGICAGVHIMAIGAEQHIPRILDAGGVIT